MPFAEMTSGVAMLFKQLRQCQFLGFHVAGICKINAVPKWMPAGDATAARRAANRRGGIKALEAQAVFRHRIEVRRADNFVAVESHIAPAEVVTHHEDDVGFFRSYQ